MQIIKHFKGRCYAGQIATPYTMQPGEKLRLSPYNSTTGEYLGGQPRYFPATKKDCQLLARESS